MDAAAEIGRNPVSKHQIQPEYGDEQADADGTAKPVSREQILSQAPTVTVKYEFSLFS